MTLESHPNLYFIRWGWRYHTGHGVDIFTPKRVYWIRW